MAANVGEGLGPGIIYLDNNATTMMSQATIAAMVGWCNKGNASSSYGSAVAAREMIESFRRYLCGLCGVGCNCLGPSYGVEMAKDGDSYRVIFTSGASESNCVAFQSVVDAYGAAVGGLPHVIVSAVEHSSIMYMAESYVERGKAEVTYVGVSRSGHVEVGQIEKSIKETTCLICVMHANNETGAINDIKSVGRIAHGRNVVFLCDAVQTFGKMPPNLLESGVDMLSMSFHKLYGPPGLGVLFVKQKLLTGYRMCPVIFGSQNFEFRGGTENLPAIGAAFAAVKSTFTSRLGKNQKLRELRDYVIREISERMPACSFAKYVGAVEGKFPEIMAVFLTEPNERFLPNTVMMSLVKKSGTAVCNRVIKNKLEAAGIIVSVGSACNTANVKASHVLVALGADEYVKRGIFRISFGDGNSPEDAKTFVKEILGIAKSYVKKTK